MIELGWASMNLLISSSKDDKIDWLQKAASFVASNLRGTLEGVGLGESRTSFIA